jgi:hypothetical protein
LLYHLDLPNPEYPSDSSSKSTDMYLTSNGTYKYSPVERQRVPLTSSQRAFATKGGTAQLNKPEVSPFLWTVSF